MRSYRRVMLGKQSIHAATCLAGNFIGADYGIHQDLKNDLPDDWRTFNKKFIPIYMAANPDKTKIGAGLACGFLWTIAKGIKIGDIVLCPDGSGQYLVGEVNGDYYYAPGDILPHRRPVTWREVTIARSEMSDALKNSTGSIGAVADISKYAAEIEALLGPVAKPKAVLPDEAVEDLASFTLEKHLEDFLVQNWPQTDLGKDYDIYEEEGEKVGQQYPTDTGPMDILALKKDKSELLVVELKKGRASDAVIGQTLRYMGYAAQELAEEGQKVRGVIIALEEDQRIRRALAVTPTVDFFRYQISFKLVKV
jgi:restriction system protein